MANESKTSRKPRQVRGTTAYKYRNLFVLSVLATSGLSWFLFEQIPFTKKVVERINGGYWDRTPEEEYRLEMIKRNLSPDTKDLMERKKEIMSKSDPIKTIEI